MSTFGLKLANKIFNSKEKDLIEAFSKKFTPLLDDEPKVILINLS